MPITVSQKISKEISQEIIVQAASSFDLALIYWLDDT